MLDKLKSILTSQSNHSAIALLAILYLSARANGIDLLGLGKEFLEVLTVLGAVSATAKTVLKDAPTVPPGTIAIPPPAAITPLSPEGKAAIVDAETKA